MFKKILVPLDGSEASKQALPIAIKIAQYTKAEILLVRSPELSKVPLPAGLEGLRVFDGAMALKHQQCSHYLGYIRQSYMDLKVPMNEFVAEGDPASVIVDTAEAEDIDLIVMTTHGRTGLRRFLLGSVTERVLRHATCPVLAVHDDRPFQEIVITLDGSELAEQALAPGLTLTQAFEAHLTLLRVLEPIDMPEEADMTDLGPEERSILQTYPEMLHQGAVDYLKNIAAMYSEIPLDYKVVSGHAAERIVDFSDDNHSDLIVMATHGDTGNDRWYYGSIAEKVVRSAPTALLIIRSHLPSGS